MGLDKLAETGWGHRTELAKSRSGKADKKLITASLQKVGSSKLGHNESSRVRQFGTGKKLAGHTQIISPDSRTHKAPP